MNRRGITLLSWVGAHGQHGPLLGIMERAPSSRHELADGARNCNSLDRLRR